MNLIGGRNAKGKNVPPCSFDQTELSGVAGRPDYRVYVDYGDIWLWMGNDKGFPVCLDRKNALKLAWFIVKWQVKDWFGIRKKLWQKANKVVLVADKQLK